MLPLRAALLLPLIATQAAAFYLPGAAPKDYKHGEDVELDVNVLKPGLGYETENLVSRLTELRSIASADDQNSNP